MSGPRHDFVRNGEWRCGCGAINAEEDSKCWQCGLTEDGIDTSDIPEAGKEWFERAKLRLPLDGGEHNGQTRIR